MIKRKSKTGGKEGKEKRREKGKSEKKEIQTPLWIKALPDDLGRLAEEWITHKSGLKWPRPPSFPKAASRELLLAQRLQAILQDFVVTRLVEGELELRRKVSGTRAARTNKKVEQRKNEIVSRGPKWDKDGTWLNDFLFGSEYVATPFIGVANKNNKNAPNKKPGSQKSNDATKTNRFVINFRPELLSRLRENDKNRGKNNSSSASSAGSATAKNGSADKNDITKWLWRFVDVNEVPLPSDELPAWLKVSRGSVYTEQEPTLDTLAENWVFEQPDSVRGLGHGGSVARRIDGGIGIALVSYLMDALAQRPFVDDPSKVFRPVDSRRQPALPLVRLSPDGSRIEDDSDSPNTVSKILADFLTGEPSEPLSVAQQLAFLATFEEEKGDDGGRPITLTPGSVPEGLVAGFRPDLVRQLSSSLDPPVLRQRIEDHLLNFAKQNGLTF